MKLSFDFLIDIVLIYKNDQITRSIACSSRLNSTLIN